MEIACNSNCIYVDKDGYCDKKIIVLSQVYHYDDDSRSGYWKDRPECMEYVRKRDESTD